MDGITKSANEENGANLATVGCLELIAELHMLKYWVEELGKIVATLRNPGVQWLVKLSRAWLERLRRCEGVERRIQNKVWELHKETGVIW